MKRVLKVLVVALFVLAVGVAPTLAHCGKKHSEEGRIYVAQLSHEDLASELETSHDVAVLERAIDSQELAEKAERLDRLIHELIAEREHKNSRAKKGKAD